MTVKHSEAGKLESIFDDCRTDSRAALIGYLPTGYPDVPTSVKGMTALVESGCDIIEVGVPYSDPGMATGRADRLDRGKGVANPHSPMQRGRWPCRGDDLLEPGVALRG